MEMVVGEKNLHMKYGGVRVREEESGLESGL